MPYFLQLSAVILAGITVAMADALIKKTAHQESIWLAVKNPWMIGVVILYVAQIIFVLYAFTHNWKLGIFGNFQMVIYSVVIVLIGFFIFKETLSTVQIIGILLALVAVFLINS